MKNEFSYLTPAQTKLFAEEWLPEKQPRGVILIVHGLGEHIGRYQHVVNKLVNKDYAVLGFDFPGHGKSEGIRGYIPKFDDYLDIIDQLLLDMENRYPKLPIFLYGHSLGGEIVLYYGLKREQNITGVIATGPSIGIGDQSKSKVTLVKFLSKIAPRMVIDSGLERAALSRDDAVVQAYNDDPLVHSKISVSLGLGMLLAGEYILEHASAFSKPLLLLAGEQDRIISISAVRQFAQKAASNVIYKEWEGGYHELHNEPDKDEVINFIIQWLSAHTQF